MKKEQKKYLKCRGTRHRAQKEDGITLIALVITIILLLLLAGVTLKIVLDSNFVDKTQLAVDKYSEAQKNETEQIKYFLENYLGEVDNTEGTEHRTLNEAEPAYNNPIIPVGFKTSSEGAIWASIDGKTVQGWNDGLVIEDKDGNQFVWVPVDGTNVKYEKWLGNNNKKITDITQLSEDTILSGIDENEQITKYGGFYIGRYEAGIPESMTEAISPIAEGEEVTTAKLREKRDVSGIPIVAKNQVPWNFINYNTSKANAENMYTGDSVKSGLLTGTMWDTTMKWLENAGENVKTDSGNWGNYFDVAVPEITEYSPFYNYGANWTIVQNITKPKGNKVDSPDFSWILKTGNTEYTKRKNIYDLAGNMSEWTYETLSSLHVVRGDYYNGSAVNAALFRYCFSVDHPNYVAGFRVALYIK